MMNILVIRPETGKEDARRDGIAEEREQEQKQQMEIVYRGVVG